MNGKEAATAFLQRMDLPFLTDSEGEMIIIPIPIEDSGYLHLRLHVDDEADAAMFDALVYRVPCGRREAVALVLADLNTTRKCVTWSMRQDYVVADVCLDLDNVLDAEHSIARAFTRIFDAVTEDRARILTAGRSRRRPPRLEREIEEIFQQVND
jgi:hypothetical protein